jgi:hypothetical protein
MYVIAVAHKTGNTRHKAETNKAKQKPINQKHNTEN